MRPHTCDGVGGATAFGVGLAERAEGAGDGRSIYRHEGRDTPIGERWSNGVGLHGSPWTKDGHLFDRDHRAGASPQHSRPCMALGDGGGC
jgi:hypothetical protein